jgi:hypothetical protein
MQLTVAYRGRSGIVPCPGGLAVALAPNLRRDRVSYVGALRSPLRFREAVSALHDVVVSDLRFKPKDKSAYEAYKAEEKQREEALYKAAYDQTKKKMKAEAQPVTPGLEKKFETLRRRYWDARQRYANLLAKRDPTLWRLLMPCDPVITVAPDVLFFECFSADESSYGCLTVGRDAFQREQDVALGTTNVDYSWALYEHFQKLRSYRETRFTVDPSGFEVATTDGGEGYREEKIDLPPSWLRGFMQLQSAMSLPMRKVQVSREGLYNVLAFLKRHRAARSPRAVRFELTPGQPVQIVLEPWEQRIVLHDTPYQGPQAETVRTWGRDRLRVLARLLPLLDHAEVFLLGTGLPSFWVARMGEMRLTLGLSGWTTNDWTGASALDQLAPPGEPTAAVLAKVASAFQASPTLTFAQVQRQAKGVAAPDVAAGLNRLALMGQLIHDLPAGAYRWRQIMPVAVSLQQLGGGESPETEAAKQLVAQGRQIKVDRDETTDSGLRKVTGKVENRPVEVLLDGDGRIVRGKCTCSHHFTGGLRKGPCRHLQALRTKVLGTVQSATLDKWYQRLWN